MKQEKSLTVKDAKEVGRNMRRIRKRLNITQQQLADKMDISNHHLSRLENGHKIPELDTLIKFCKATDVEIILQQK